MRPWMPWYGYEDDAHSSTERHDLSCRDAELPRPLAYVLLRDIGGILLRASIGAKINADNLCYYHYFALRKSLVAD